VTLEAPRVPPADGARTRWVPLQLAGVLIVGVVLGAVLTFIVQDRGAAGDDRPGSGAPADPNRHDGAVVGSGAPPTQQVLLAWSADPLPDGLGTDLVAVPGVERVTAVSHGAISLVERRPGGSAVVDPKGWPAQVVPADVIAVDPGDYPAFVPPELASTFAGLRAGEVVLGRTGAGLRGATVGDVIEAEDTALGPVLIRLTVVAIVDDAVIGGAELAVSVPTGAELGLSPSRYLLIAHHGDRAAIEERVRSGVDELVRFRGPGETPFLRDGDAVLPQALVKARFGEFGLGEPDGPPVQDQTWFDDHIVTVDLPVLGRVQCHRGVIDDLRAAMEQIEREHLDYLIDPTPSSRACWYPDIIDRTGMLSRGYWGIAVVLNSMKNPTGSSSVQDPRIVTIMQEHGFTWGGDFLVPEPSYFEHVGSATAPLAPPEPPG
jgi:hypothetical protein